MIELQVSVPGGAYPVMIEAGLLSRVGDLIEDVHDGRTGLIVVDENVRGPHGDTIQQGFSTGWDMAEHQLVATESCKRIEAVASILESCLAAGLDRGSLIVAIGGGITGDVAGFAAASYMRGIALVQVPTTLLAMVDAAVGGKTGVNLPLPGGAGIGKNLAGAFWQPRAVLVDPLVLASLSPRDLRCGLAECIKHGLISDPGLFDLIESQQASILKAEPAAISTLVERAVQVKVGVIQADEREASSRAVLNLGHTFAHAIEPIERLDLRHGEAVAIGLVAALHAALDLGRVDKGTLERTCGLLELVGLPTRLDGQVEVDDLVNAMQFDKKTLGGRLRLVLPGADGVDIVEDVPGETVRTAWRAVGASG